MRTIKAYAQVLTHASVMDGDYDHIDGPDEITVTIDELDIEEHGGISEAYAYAAVKAVRDYGSVEPSSLPGFHPGMWYSTIDGETDCVTGETTHYSIHFDDFTEEEQRIIHGILCSPVRYR